MRKINRKCNNNESFMYSIIISLRYYDISHNPERITKLRPYINNYNFTNNTANGFEMYNPHVSLEIMDEDEKLLLIINACNNKAVIFELNNCRYAAIKPMKNKYIKLKKILQSFTHKEINDMTMQKITH